MKKMERMLIRGFSVLAALAALYFCSSGTIIISMKLFRWSFNIKWLDKMLTETDGLSALVFVIIGFLFAVISFGAFVLSLKGKTK